MFLFLDLYFLLILAYLAGSRILVKVIIEILL